ncbi:MULTISPECIES: hypothetical protein [Geobacillus]|nr:hypothetical protein [Geobacillus sp. A8]EQB94381.1 hypothetical protein GA8_17310 [Geobacillus sp. A8]MED3668821.1 hypothetical protein [Geobacillus kaustophilus]
MKRTKITKDHGWTHALSESKSGKSKMLPRANASWLFAWSWKDIWEKTSLPCSIYVAKVCLFVI